MGHNMKKQLIFLFTLTLIATLVISACGSPEQATIVPTQVVNTVEATEPPPPTATSEPDPCAPENISTEVEEVHKLMREFDDASLLASNTPIEQLNPSIAFAAIITAAPARFAAHSPQCGRSTCSRLFGHLKAISIGSHEYGH